MAVRSALLWVFPVLFALSGARSQPPSPGPEKPADPGQDRAQASRPALPPEATAAEARAMVADLRKRLAQAKGSPHARSEAVLALVQKRHPTFVQALGEVLRRDDSKVVRASALKAMGSLPYRESRRALLGALGDPKLLDEPLLLMAALDGLAVQGYDGECFPVLERLFLKSWDLETPAEVQRRIWRLFGQGPEKQAFRLLLENLDEPRPVNIDDASNPPAEYWEKRWKAWRAWRNEVKEALKGLTGVEFDSAELYRKWAKKHGARLGLKG